MTTTMEAKMTTTDKPTMSTEPPSPAVVRQAMASVEAAVKKLVQQLESAKQREKDLTARRDVLYRSPLNPADVRQFLSELIDFRADFAETMMRQHNVMDVLSSPRRRVGIIRDYSKPAPALTLEEVEQSLGRRRPDGQAASSLTQDGWMLDILPMQNDFPHWVYFILREILKEKLGQLVADVNPSMTKPGPPIMAASMDERRQEIEKIETDLTAVTHEIGRIQSEIDSLINPISNSAKSLKPHRFGAV